MLLITENKLDILISLIVVPPIIGLLIGTCLICFCEFKTYLSNKDDT